MIGWAGDKKSLIFKEENGTEFGYPRIIPSLEGDGLYSTILIPSNPYSTGDLIRITSAGITSAVSTSAGDQNATHYIFGVYGSYVSIANTGSWTISGLSAGPVYLSTSANTITQEYSGIEQQIGIYDSSKLHLNFSVAAVTSTSNTETAPTLFIKGDGENSIVGNDPLSASRATGSSSIAIGMGTTAANDGTFAVFHGVIIPYFSNFCSKSATPLN